MVLKTYLGKKTYLEKKNLFGKLWQKLTDTNLVLSRGRAHRSSVKNVAKAARSYTLNIYKMKT